MTRKIIISFGLIIAIIVCSVLFVVVYKAIVGSGIEHFKQFFFRCQGQMNFYEGDQAEIKFYFVDEKELSEMGSVENILGVNLITDDGSVLHAESWVVENFGRGYLNLEGEYFERTFKIYLTADKTFIINKIEIIYPDITEQFDIGSLKINVIEKAPFVMQYVQIISYVWNFEISSYMPGVTQYNLARVNSMEYFNVRPMGKDYEITNIDFGITGFGIDPATIREYIPVEFDEITQQVSFGEEFTLNPDYEIYLKPQTVDELPCQNFDLDINGTPGNSRIHRIFSTCITPEYFSDLYTITYLSPIFTCVDAETQNIYQYCTSLCMLSSPTIHSDEIMQSVLEEYGV